MDRIGNLVEPRPLPASTPRVTVLMPCLNAKHCSQKRLESLLAQDYPNYDICIMLGSATGDGILEIERFVACDYSRVRIIAKSANAGMANFVHDVFDRLDSEFVLICGSEVGTSSQMLTQLVGLIEAEPLVGAVSPAVVPAPGCGPIDDVWTHISGRVADRGDFAASSPCYTTAVNPFGSVLFRRSAVLRTGQFGEIHLAAEAARVLSFEIRRSGYKVLFAPQAQAYHGVGPFGNPVKRNATQSFEAGLAESLILISESRQPIGPSFLLLVHFLGAFGFLEGIISPGAYLALLGVVLLFGYWANIKTELRLSIMSGLYGLVVAGAGRLVTGWDLVAFPLRQPHIIECYASGSIAFIVAVMLNHTQRYFRKSHSAAKTLLVPLVFAVDCLLQSAGVIAGLVIGFWRRSIPEGQGTQNVDIRRKDGLDGHVR